MKSPRRGQRFPRGGQNLYELMRMDHEPILIWVLLAGDITLEQADEPDTLSFEADFDPMVYFWPVDGQHVVVRLEKPAEELEKRLVKALLRDGAMWVTVCWCTPKFDWVNYGDPDGFMQKRFGPVESAAVPA